MPSRSKKPYLEWFGKAEEDGLSIRAILKEEASASTACFLSQQMTEKYLKGLLVFHRKSSPKVHDLLQLETALLDCQKDVRKIEKSLDFLNRYYIITLKRDILGISLCFLGKRLMRHLKLLFALRVLF